MDSKNYKLESIISMAEYLNLSLKEISSILKIDMIKIWKYLSKELPDSPTIGEEVAIDALLDELQQIIEKGVWDRLQKELSKNSIRPLQLSSGKPH